MSLLESTLKAIQKIEIDPDGKIQDRLNSLAKPRNSLGRLEELGRLLGTLFPRFTKRSERFKAPAKTLLVFAADHGVAARKVSPYDQAMSAKVLSACAKGKTAVNVLAASAGAKTVFIDCGLKSPVKTSGVKARRVGKGTKDFTKEPAMTREEAIQAIEAGIETVQAQKGSLEVIGVATLGVANTTTAAALVCALSGKAPEAVTGAGSGADQEIIFRKADAVRDAIKLHDPDPDDAIGLITQLGGFEIAAVAGACLAAAQLRKAVVLDGFASTVGGLLAARLAPDALGVMVPSHLAPEPGHAAAVAILKRQPLLVMNMRLAGGCGACLAMPILDAAARVLATMATAKEAGL